MKLIKAVYLPQYQVELFQSPDHSYVVTYEDSDGEYDSEGKLDYKTASFIFDITLSGLEGQ